MHYSEKFLDLANKFINPAITPIKPFKYHDTELEPYLCYSRINDNGAIDDYDYKRIKNAKIKALFVDMGGKYFPMDFSSPIIQWYMNDAIEQYNAKNALTADYQRLYSKWYALLPKVFYLSPKGYKATKIKDMRIFFNGYTSHQNYAGEHSFNAEIYKFLQLLEEAGFAYPPGWVYIITFADEDKTWGEFAVGKMQCGITKNENGYYYLHSIVDSIGISHTSQLQTPLQILEMLNMKEN